jgi:surfeit locus 1 family protein
MRRIPIFATIIAMAAVLTMVGLGIWQLQRKAEKEALLAQYEGAAILTAVSYPDGTLANEALPLFRRSQVECKAVTGWRNISGANDKGDAGYAHLATCVTGGNMTAVVAVGWSKRPENPNWRGGWVNGIIAPHKPEPIKLVATDKVDDLELLTKPSPANIPNNHLLYAIQWFIFAFAAAVIYALAARAKMRR